MRCGLIVYGSLDTVSGGYLYDRQLVTHLRAAGDEVEIIALPWRNYGRHLTDNGAGRLRRRLQTGGWDVLLQDELNHPSLFALNRWLRPRVRYPLIAIVHHLRCSEARPAWQNALYRQIERAYLHSVDGFIFNSQTTRAVVAGLLDPSAAARQAAAVVYPAADHHGPALDPDVIAARVQAAGPRRVLFLGNVSARKGLHVLLDALARVTAEWRLTVVGGLDGEPAYTRSIQTQIQRLNLAGRVTVRGRLTDAQVRAELETHHLLAVPSFYEGFGIAYLEALACGLPVLATTAGAAGELITPGVDGALVPPGDAPALADALRPLLTEPVTLLRQSLAARARFQRHPTWAATMQTARAFLQAQAARPV